MPDPSTLVLFIGASLLLLLVPGPAVVYIITRGTMQGRRAALVSVAGIHVGTLVHIPAGVAGLSALLVASASAFAAVKLAGAAYLLYLGVKALWASRRSSQVAAAPVTDRAYRRIFVDGVVVNVLNPKTAVFFLAFVPQFVNVDAGSVTMQLIVLGVVFVATGLLTDGAYAVASGWLGQRLGTSPTFARRRAIFSGTSYLGLGLVTAFSGSNK